MTAIVPSRLSAGFFVGADWFERRGLVVAQGEAPRGLLDALEELAHPHIAIDRVHDDVRAFFERTAEL